MSTVVSLTTIAICMIILTAATFLMTAGLVIAIFAFRKMISRKIDEAMDKVQPVVDQAKAIAEQAKNTTDRVSEKVDSIAAKAETTAERVGDKVQSVTEKVEESMSPQVMVAAGLIGTALRAFQIYREATKGKRVTVRTEQGQQEAQAGADVEAHI